MQERSCLTCHVLYASSVRAANVHSPFLTTCCTRWICDSCLKRSPRFLDYCPFCQKIALEPLPRSVEKPLLPQNTIVMDAWSRPAKDAKNEKLGNGVLHYVRRDDTLTGLAFKYGVEREQIRRANRLFNDNIWAHSKLFIPNVHAPSLSDKLSPEDERKMLVKRFQLRSKCVDPAEAKVYMEQSNYDVEAAIQAYRDDLHWELSHPFPANKLKHRQHHQPRRRQGARPVSQAQKYVDDKVKVE